MMTMIVVVVLLFFGNRVFVLCRICGRVAPVLESLPLTLHNHHVLHSLLHLDSLSATLPPSVCLEAHGHILQL